MDKICTPQGTAAEAATAPIDAHPPVALYRELGQITRQLHDSLSQLGVMPRLQEAAQGLPDARSRLNYVAERTAQAAHRVLDSVDSAKAAHQALSKQSKDWLARLSAPDAAPVSAAAMVAYVQSVEALSAQTDRHLTDIMLAQDFHDLTGQVVRKVLDVANSIEGSLVQLLVQSAPDDAQSGPRRPEEEGLQGPLVCGTRQGDVVGNQAEVDDLLASLGF